MAINESFRQAVKAVCNGTSEYHDCIIRLVEKNMSLIKKRIA